MGTRQEIIFLNGEGDAWFRRNQEPSTMYSDPVMAALDDVKGFNPRNAIEIGCGTGWRLQRIYDRYDGCCVYGLDPSIEAVSYGANNYSSIAFRQGTANDLAEYKIHAFDLIIFGFCLYLCDRNDLFNIVNLAHKKLNDGGLLVIHDFLPDAPHCRPYHHVNGVYSYKMDYSKLWLANPAYELVKQIPTREGEAVTIIRKNENNAWPAIK